VVTAKTQRYNLKNAREYFEEHLCVGDYYDEGQRVAGEWVGMGAEKSSDCPGRCARRNACGYVKINIPALATIDQRMNTRGLKVTRTLQSSIFYDFTFSRHPIGFIVGFLGNDKRVFEAHTPSRAGSIE